MNIEKIRSEFPILQKKVKGKPIIYLDNAATSLKPISVIEEEIYYYKELSANVHRGIHKLSEESTRALVEGHKAVGKFINAKEKEIIFTNNTTMSINTIMYSLLNNNYFDSGGKILLTEMEHHANIVPWQFVEQKTKAKIEFVKVNEKFELDLNDLQNKLSRDTKLVSMAHTSNTIATINPIKEIGKIVKDSTDAYFIVDAAQSAPHMELDAKKIGADFIAFSAHKMLGPTGLGVLYGKEELLKKMNPFIFGGEMIHSVKWHSASWNELPWKFEAGTPNIAAIIAFPKALDYLKKIGFSEIEAQEKKLLKHLFERLTELKKIKTYNPMNAEKQSAILLFELAKMHCHDLALALDETENIAIRSGMHCAEPIVSRYNSEGLDRASMYFYNSIEEIDAFIEALKKIEKTFG